MKRLYPDEAYHPAPSPSYWRATTPAAEKTGAPLDADLTVGTAVIGAGYTGLNAALRLAERGEDVAVFDAGYPGWGASGRNGGFVCTGGTKLDYAAQIKRFGRDETASFVSRQRAAIDHVAEVLDRFAIDADRHSDGEWMLAHSRRAFEDAGAEAEVERGLGIPVEPHSQAALDDRGMSGPCFHGGYHRGVGFAINPLKYAHGLAGAAASAGARLCSASKVEAVTPDNGYRLSVNGFEVRAAKLIVACNGYARDQWIPWLSGRFLPVVSSIVVTEPLSDDDLAAQGWTSDQAAYDTRALVHYFRLLPERRFMFGMRGGSSLTPAADRRLDALSRTEFERLFPGWAHAPTAYRWSGLLSLARDQAQYTGPLGDWPGAWTSFAYHGNGVAMGSYAGRLLAEMALGDLAPGDLPAIMRAPARRFPAPALRMAYIKAYYALWDLKEFARG